jgi:acyl dehydratase
MDLNMVIETENSEFLELVGHRLGPYLSFNPVSATQIWQWCSAMGDHNPDYLPGLDQVAPPAMMQMWTMRDINDNYAPGSTTVVPYQVFDDMAKMGYPANVAVSYDITFLRYLCAGEHAQHYTTIVNISEKKKTALGIGYFVTEQVEYLTQDEQFFARALITYFQYCAKPIADRSASTPEQKSPNTEIDQKVADQSLRGWQSDFVDIDINTIEKGDMLPELTIPITHKLIVGGAIACQDFIPVHHNVPAAKAAGMADVFMNILTTSGLSARYLSDWAGQGSRLRKIKFNLLAPNFPGDTMTMQGEVEAVTATASGAEVAVKFIGKNGMGHHIEGSATLALP